MAEPFYVARATIAKVAPLHRHATLALGATAEFGVHGPVCDLFELSPPRALPLLPVLRSIQVHYRLRVPADARERAERALAKHQEKCPTAQSLRGAVAVSWSAEFDPA